MIHSGLTALLRPKEKSENSFVQSSENEKSNSNLNDLSEQQEQKFPLVEAESQTEVEKVPNKNDKLEKVPNKNDKCERVSNRNDSDEVKCNPIRSRVNTLDLTGYKVRTAAKDNSYSTFQTGSGKISSALGEIKQIKINHSMKILAQEIGMGSQCGGYK